MNRPRLTAILALTGFAFTAFANLAWPEDPTMRQLFPADALGFPGIEQELGRDVYDRQWDLGAEDRANVSSTTTTTRRTPRPTVCLTLVYHATSEKWQCASSD
jgi:hypothetical protein